MAGVGLKLRREQINPHKENNSRIPQILAIYLFPLSFALIAIGWFCFLVSFESERLKSVTEALPLLIWTFLMATFWNQVFAYAFQREISERIFLKQMEGLTGLFYSRVLIYLGLASLSYTGVLLCFSLPYTWIFLAILLLNSLLFLNYLLSFYFLLGAYRIFTSMFLFSFPLIFLLGALFPKEGSSFLLYVFVLYSSLTLYGVWFLPLEHWKRDEWDIRSQLPLLEIGCHLGMAFILPFVASWWSDQAVILHGGLSLAPSFDLPATLAYLPTLASMMFLHLAQDRRVDAIRQSYFQALSGGASWREMKRRESDLRRGIWVEVVKIEWVQGLWSLGAGILFFFLGIGLEGMFLLLAYWAWGMGRVYMQVLFGVGDDAGVRRWARFYGICVCLTVGLSYCINARLIPLAFMVSSLFYARSIRHRLKEYLLHLTYYVLSPD